MRIVTYLAFITMSCSLVWMGLELRAKEREIADLRDDLGLVHYRAEARKEMIVDAKVFQRVADLKKQVYDVTVTAYNPTASQCDDDPTITASMRKVRPGTIAVSRDLFDQGWVFGRKVRIEGMGIFEINDLMNVRYTKAIDVFMWDDEKAIAFGRRVRKVALLNI